MIFMMGKVHKLGKETPEQPNPICVMGLENKQNEIL